MWLGVYRCTAWAVIFLGITSASNRTEKVLNVFQVVRFPNDACTTDSNEKGVCYTESECTALGGGSDGSCASGFGVCCKFTATCGATVSVNNTYFTHSDSMASPCSLKVCRASSNICQLRMDFDTFELDQPVTTLTPTDGTVTSRTQCQNGIFTASSDSGSAPILCGKNTDQHMYVEADDSCNDLEFSWSPVSDGPRKWNILVSQIPCDVTYKAPEGCTQYYTGTTGTIENYNYDGGIHLANHHYNACIRQEEGYCTIAYSASTFEISGTGSTALSGSSCTTDYVMIPRGGASVSTSPPITNSDRFCGSLLGTGTASGTVYAVRYPYTVGVYFDEGETNPPSTTEKATGFSIYFAQSTSCS